MIVVHGVGDYNIMSIILILMKQKNSEGIGSSSSNNESHNHESSQPNPTIISSLRQKRGQRSPNWSRMCNTYDDEGIPSKTNARVVTHALSVVHVYYAMHALVFKAGSMACFFMSKQTSFRIRPSNKKMENETTLRCDCQIYLG